MILPAKRLDTVQEYYFSKKLREVRSLVTAGKSIINMGVESPDLQPPIKVIETIQGSLSDANAHKYQSYQGLPELRNAIASFCKNRFSVNVNLENWVLPLMGSKEGIMHISMAFLNEGDQVLISNPRYPTYTSVAKLVGAEPFFYN
jgi:LL-diaminopimelate aminotransferase